MNMILLFVKFQKLQKKFRRYLYFISLNHILLQLNKEENELYDSIKNKMMKKYEKDDGLDKNSND